MCSPSIGSAGFAPRRCSPRSSRRSCDRCAWGYRRRVFPRGHCDGIPAAFDWRWAVTSFSFVGLLISLAELLSFPRRAPVSTGNTQYKVSNPFGALRFQHFTGPRALPFGIPTGAAALYPANGRCPLTPAVRCRPCTPAQRAGCPLHTRTGKAGVHRSCNFRRFHRLRIHAFASDGGRWMRNTPLGITDQGAGCRPGVFSERAPISDVFSTV